MPQVLGAPSCSAPLRDEIVIKSILLTSSQASPRSRGGSSRVAAKELSRIQAEGEQLDFVIFTDESVRRLAGEHRACFDLMHSLRL
jgi:hypothetical protein